MLVLPATLIHDLDLTRPQLRDHDLVVSRADVGMQLAPVSRARNAFGRLRVAALLEALEHVKLLIGPLQSAHCKTGGIHQLPRVCGAKGGRH